MKVEISFKHLTKTQGLKQHINETVGTLDRYVPARRRQHIHASVNIDQKSAKAPITAKATLHMKGKDIAASEKSEKGDDVFIVIDKLENKLKTQLKKQRSQHRRHRLRPSRISNKLRAKKS